MRLNAQTVTMGREYAVAGIHSGIMKDDVNGAVLVIQSEITQTRVKLSDLMAFLKEQKEFDDLAKPSLREVKD